MDETAVKTNLTRPRGERLTMDAPFGSWGTQNLIAPWDIKGAMDGPAYIREVPIPEIAPGTAAVLDNLAPPSQQRSYSRAQGTWLPVPLSVTPVALTT